MGKKRAPQKILAGSNYNLHGPTFKGREGKRELGGATLGNYPQQTGGRGERVVKKMLCFPTEVSNIA